MWLRRSALVWSTVASVPAAACGPTIDPAWLIVDATEIAVEVEVVEQGPLGERLAPSTRSYRDALPLDTLSIRPIIVDGDGPIDVDQLEGAWMLCEGFGNCLANEPVTGRPQCTFDTLSPEQSCRFSNDAITTLTLGDVPGDFDVDEQSVLSLLSGPTIGFIASTPEGPGLDTCMQRLDDRRRLDGCLLVERVLGVGPLAELSMYLEALGIDPGISEEAQTLLAIPRNRNPAVEEFIVRAGRDTQRVAMGEMVTVPADQEISVTLTTTDADLDAYEVEDNDEIVTFSDTLNAQWWFDRDIDRVETTLDTLTVRLRADGQDATRVYVALRETRRGEGWGFIDLRFSP